MASSLESVVSGVPTLATMKLSTNCTLSWEYLTKLSANPDELFQPPLVEAGGLGVDVQTNQDPGWVMFTIIRKVRISEKKVHARFNGWYLVK